MKMDKKKVIFRGPGLTSSGYGVHARQIIKWLLTREDVDLRVQLFPWGNTPWLLNPDECDGLVRKILSMSTHHSGKADVSFQLQLPNEWDINLAHVNVGMTAGVETDICNPDWIRCCNLMNLIIVPSEHVKNTLEKSGKLTASVIVVPESYPEAFETANSDNEILNFDTKFNFLMVGQITGNNPENDRKNIFYTIKWFCETFKNEKDVGLIIKTNAGRNTLIDRNVTHNIIGQVIREIKKAEYPRIHVVHGHLSDEEMYQLYNQKSVKAFLCPTRGEGFGLPLLEAAACGLPVITTNWSGHLDFLSHGKFIKLDSTLKEVHASRVDNKIFMKGSKWAEPIEADFKKNVKKFYESPYLPKDWAVELQKKILEKYSFKAVCKLYDQVTGDIFC